MSDPKDENPGLFAKVIKFVRNPASGWSGLELPEEERESGYSRQMLKEMIERKRRNDFVRRREFDMLRKLRRSEVIAGNDPAARPSFFQSSLPSRPDDRASTLKKIDEIEAQMSQQWWKTRNGEPTTTGGLSRSTIPPLTSSGPTGLPGSRVGGFSPSEGLSIELPLLHAQTQPLTVEATLPATVPNVLPPSAQPPSVLASTLDFSPELAPVEEFTHDAELEDVAIRFAQGDDAGVEAGLQALVGAGGTRQDHVETWLVLFDFYRATGRQERFDEAALSFAERFGRSAPQWIAFGGPARGGPAQPAGPAAPVTPVDWTCPPVLTAAAFPLLQAALARAPQPWRLSWGRLGSIDESALAPLAQLLGQWAAQPVALRFVAAECLEAALKARTPPADASVPAAWWRLRMEALRLLNRPDEFEMVAMDFCIAYEVSPPSWEAPRCRVAALDADGQSAAPASAFPREPYADSVASVPASGFGEPASRFAPMPQGELAGALQDDATALLARLPAVSAGQSLSVDCARLVRIDFGAAGSLLNWCTARQAEGCLLQFTGVHRLVAAFFAVVGIDGTARIALRRD
ncbi:STAS domain-containing protein [Ramlibacter rhizophilus]|uniref:STAS domain-containing protein n=1 Tax=Ramlibacter rhizophilus TaxID=1781167 RepID=A0A4Z0BMR9_9BURK|nr:STAS domain-containing protein [Ramlibacter rhizophilus]TFY99719.1 STAS domain-containing protein [Ramlibacter rhizophilus]